MICIACFPFEENGIYTATLSNLALENVSMIWFRNAAVAVQGTVQSKQMKRKDLSQGKQICYLYIIKCIDF